MKNIKPKLVALLKTGHCTPQIARLAKRLREPAATLHYNLRKMEKDGDILAYKAVFDHKKIDEGFCSLVLINLSPDEYGDPERIGKELARHPEIEMVDICTGDWELVIKVRTKDQDEYYQFVKNVISRKGVIKIKTLTSLKQMKSEFIEREEKKRS